MTQATSAKPAATPSANGGDTVTLSRAELTTLVADGVTEALKRQDEAKAKAEADAAAKAEEEAKAGEQITRSALKSVVEEATKPLMERLTNLEGSTVLRSAQPDAPATTNADELTPEQKELKRQADMKSGAVFSGILGLGGKK